MLRHRTEQEEYKLKGVDLTSDADDVPLGQFIGLQNWIHSPEA